MTFIHRSFPISLQHDSMMCGVACLQMICRHYGKNYTQDELSDICHTGLAGVSLLGLADAAETLGFRIFSSKFTVDNLGKVMRIRPSGRELALRTVNLISGLNTLVSDMTLMPCTKLSMIYVFTFQKAR